MARKPCREKEPRFLTRVAYLAIRACYAGRSTLSYEKHMGTGVMGSACLFDHYQARLWQHLMCEGLRGRLLTKPILLETWGSLRGHEDMLGLERKDVV